MKNTDSRKKQLTPELLNECQKLKSIFESKKKELKISQGTIADEMGINQSSVSHYLNGVNALNANAAAAFARILKVDVSEFSKRLADELNKLALSSSQSNIEPVAFAVSNCVYKYPVISWVSAGIGCEAWQPTYVDDFVTTDINAGENGFWLRVKGDSMTSTSGISFPDGVLILVNPSAEIHNDNFIVAKIVDTNEATFKQYVEEAGIKYLKPLNSAYRMQELNEHWQIIGKIVDARWRL